MVFSSPFFVFFFLPFALLLCAVSPRSARNSVLLAISLLFYAWGEKTYVLLMIASIAINYAIGLWVARGGRLALIVGIGINLWTLIAFKYANFLVGNLNGLLISMHFPGVELRPVHLPIGVSFFTFEAIAYLVDIRRGETKAQRNPLDFALFMTFFPHLIAGPVVRYRDLASALARRVVTREGFAIGVRRFIVGLAKKALLANTMGRTADILFGLPPDQLSASAAWLGIACYSLHIYFDFSGYSDMAIGLAKLFGFDLSENFRYPYSAASVADFWRRWHISLSTWFRDYLYIPLGGNRAGRLRTCLNLLAVFALCGLWHGASWSFLVWGLFHGAFLAAERAGVSRWLTRLPLPLGHAYTLGVVMAGWVFFRADTLTHALGYLGAMAGLAAGPHLAGDYLNRELLLALAIGVAACLPIAAPTLRIWRSLPDRMGMAGELAGELVRVAALAGLFVAAAMQLAADTYNPFIYFRF